MSNKRDRNCSDLKINVARISPKGSVFRRTGRTLPQGYLQPALEISSFARHPIITSPAKPIVMVFSSSRFM